MLQVEDLTVKFGDMAIVKEVSFAVLPQQWLMIVGPNGAGKSTLLHAISQGIAYTGSVVFMGKDIAGERPAILARKLGVLMQTHYVGYAFTVDEVVRLGRYAYSKGAFSSFSDEDETMIEEALECTGLRGIRTQSVLTLSGGELQRTFLAQLLAQDPKLLILDEPSNHLDLLYQKQVFDLIREWAQRQDRAVISVVHDLSLAKAYGTHALLMHQGRQLACGAIGDVLISQNLQEAYEMNVHDWMRKMMSQWVEA